MCEREVVDPFLILYIILQVQIGCLVIFKLIVGGHEFNLLPQLIINHMLMIFHRFLLEIFHIASLLHYLLHLVDHLLLPLLIDLLCDFVEELSVVILQKFHFLGVSHAHASLHKRL